MGDKRDGDTSVILLEQLQTDPSDPRAWKLLFERYHPMIRSWCLRWGVQAADADDISQDVLLKLLNAFRQYRYAAKRGHARRKGDMIDIDSCDSTWILRESPRWSGQSTGGKSPSSISDRRTQMTSGSFIASTTSVVRRMAVRPNR
jgi:hypothetical protein